MNFINTKRWILLAMMFLLVGCAQDPAQVEPSPTPIPDEDIATSPTPLRTGVTILADGVVQARQPALPLASETGGILLAVHVQPGDQVQEGDVLAELGGAAVTSTELSVIQTQKSLDDLYLYADLVTAQAALNLATAQDELDKAERTRTVQQEGNRASQATTNAAAAQLEIAKEARDRANEMFNHHPEDRTLQIEYANAQRNYTSALANWNWYTGNPTETQQAILDAEVALARARFEAAQVEYERVKDGPDPNDIALTELQLAEAQALLARSKILIAPMGGTVLSVEAAPGASVGGGFPIITLLDTTQLEFHTTNLSERDLAQILPGQTAVVTLKAYPDVPIEAEVVRIGWQAGATVGDAVSFPVMLVLTETDLVIRPGMTGRVEIRSME